MGDKTVSEQVRELIDELCAPDIMSWERYAGVLNAVVSDCEMSLDSLAEEHDIPRRDLNQYEEPSHD
jgi:hypothetical protein